MKNLNKILFAIFTFSTLTFPQTSDPEVILKKVLDAFNKVEDYEVNVNIKVDVDFLKVPETDAKIYFKQPDKVHFISETFAMLPREGFDFSPSSLLKKKYTSFFVRYDTIDNYKTSIVKVIPLGETDDVILSTLWIDQSKNVIRKVESTTKTKGTFAIELKYNYSEVNYPLPSLMVFSFNIDKTNLPMGFSGELNSDTKTKNKDIKPTTTGKVYITYSNYKVNIGIPDKVFDKPKK